MLTAPFVRLTAPALERISQLSVTWHGGYATPERDDAERRLAAALAYLLHGLRGLRRLRLDVDLPENHHDLQLLSHALAGLPHLEHLELRTGPMLAWLSGSVRRLTLHRGRTGLWWDAAPLDLRMVAGIQRLDRLEVLRLEGLGGPPSSSGPELELRLLLQHLPPALHTLELPDTTLLFEVGCDVVLRFQRGALVSLETGPQDCCSRASLAGLARFASASLLPSGVVREPWPDCVRLHRVYLGWGDQRGDFYDPEAPTTRALRKLLEHSRVVEVRALAVEPHVQPDALRAAVKLLGPRVGALELGTGGGDVVSVRLSMGSAAQAALAAGAAAAAPVVGAARTSALKRRDPAAPKPPSLVDLVLARMGAPLAGADVGGGRAERGAPGLDGASAAAEVAAGSSGGSGASAWLRAQSPSSADGSADSSLLLLVSGPLLADARSPQGYPNAACTWLRQLAQRTNAALAPSGTGTGAEGQAARCWLMLPHMSLPTAATVLAACEGPAHELGVLEATAAAMAAEAAAASAQSTPARATGTVAAAQPPPPLQVQALPLTCDSLQLYEHIVDVMGEVMQSISDGEGVSAGWCEEQRRQWLVEQWAHIRAMCYDFT